MFIDEVTIRVNGGRGGDGCVAFRREKYIPHGGPNGGDGGNGGSVYCEVDPQINTLLDLTNRRVWKGGAGGPGGGTDCHGRNGADKIIRVPAGTVLYDEDRGVVLKDLVDPGHRICVARGGRGGHGNAHFKSATNQAPRTFEPGGEGRARKLRLELKLIADVGLVGQPNAGKSTLLSRLSAARPKIADYPFTTLEPQLGIVDLPGFRRLVMADLPGLIEGAHHGAGLGDAFLRHIERTRIIVHMVDIAPLAGDPAANYQAIRHELAEYSTTLADKPEIVVANKMDLTGAKENLRRLRGKLGVEVLPISGVTGKGLPELTERIWTVLQELGDRPPATKRERRSRRSS
jgi:GTPase